MWRGRGLPPVEQPWWRGRSLIRFWSLPRTPPSRNISTFHPFPPSPTKCVLDGALSSSFSPFPLIPSKFYSIDYKSAKKNAESKPNEELKPTPKPFFLKTLEKLTLFLGSGLLLFWLFQKTLSWHEEVDEEENENAILHSLGKNIWVIRHHFQQPLDRIATSNNMFVIRLEEGGLLLYNPVKLTPRIKSELLGLHQPIKYVIVPNGYFLEFYRDYLEAFPSIQLFWSPNSHIFLDLKYQLQLNRDKQLAEKYQKDMKMFQELGSEPPPNTWDRSELDQFVFSGFFPEEVVMFHRPSRTLLTCGLVSNLSPSSIALRHRTFVPLLYRHSTVLGGPPLVGYGLGKHHPQLLDPIKAWEGVQRVRRWPFSSIGMARGEVITSESSEEAQTFWELQWMSHLHSFFDEHNKPSLSEEKKDKKE